VPVGPPFRDGGFWSDPNRRKGGTTGMTEDRQEDFVVVGANQSFARTKTIIIL